ncbi:MAG: PAS domain S-box protein [Promethearchaeota archaeon]
MTISEEKYQVILDNTDSIIIEMDLDGKITLISPKSFDIFGYQKKNIRELSLSEFIHSDDLSTIIQIKNKMMDFSETFSLEFRARHKEGHYIHFTGKCNMIIENGKPKLILVLKDSSRQEEAELKLKESEAKFRTIAEQSFMGIAVVQNGVYKYINQQFADIFGYSIDEIINMPPEKASFVIHPEDRKWVRRQSIKKQRGEKDVINHYQFRGIKKSGETIWLEIYSKTILIEEQFADLVTLIDITKKKIAKQKLIASEELYRLITENANDLITIVNMKAEIEYINQNVHERVLGYKKEYWIGLKPYTLVHQNDKKLSKRFTKQLLDTGEAVFEARHRTKNGEYIWLEIKGRVFEDTRGNIKILLISRDMTDRKKADEELRESEAKYRLISENANDLITILDMKFKIEYVNQQVHERVLGYKKEYLIGLDSINLLHLDDRESAYRSGRQLLDTGEAVYEARFKTNHGEYVWLELKGRVFKDTQGNNKILIVSRDITDRKKADEELRESEEKYRLISENANDLITVINVNDNKIDYLNQSILGYTKENLIGKSAFKIINPDDLKKALNKIEEGSKTGEGKEELRLKGKNNFHIWMEIKGQIYVDKDGQQKALLIGRDITERKALEETRKNYLQKLEEKVNLKTKELQKEKKELQNALANLETAQEQLIQSEKLASIGLLAAGIAHEINNPLMGIINYAHIVKTELNEYKDIDMQKKPYSFLNGIIREGERIAEIVQGLLTFARKDKGQFIYADISEIIKSAVSLLSPKIKNSQIDLQMEFDKDLPKILMQTQSIRQVILNIIQNSITALDEKFKEISNNKLKKILIKTSVVKKRNKEYGMTWIKDTGIGIPQKYFSKIFDPFFTTKTGTEKHGVGLGLSISYGIIKDHNGEIIIRSKLKEYTIVEILLPLKGNKTVKN